MLMAFLPTSFFVTRSQKSAQRPPHEEQEIARVRDQCLVRQFGSVRVGSGYMRCGCWGMRDETYAMPRVILRQPFFTHTPCWKEREYPGPSVSCVRSAHEGCALSANLLHGFDQLHLQNLRTGDPR